MTGWDTITWTHIVSSVDNDSSPQQKILSPSHFICLCPRSSSSVIFPLRILLEYEAAHKQENACKTTASCLYSRVNPWRTSFMLILAIILFRGIIHLYGILLHLINTISIWQRKQDVFVSILPYSTYSMLQIIIQYLDLSCQDRDRGPRGCPLVRGTGPNDAICRLS